MIKQNKNMSKISHEEFQDFLKDYELKPSSTVDEAKDYYAKNHSILQKSAISLGEEFHNAMEWVQEATGIQVKVPLALRDYNYQGGMGCGLQLVGNPV